MPNEALDTDRPWTIVPRRHINRQTRQHGCYAIELRAEEYPVEDPMAPVTEAVLFEVGQIVHHLRYDYRGVIVGCDATCMADDAWYDFQTQGKSSKPTKQQPWYHVLVDGTTQQTYVAQQNLEPGDASHGIVHPMLDSVFATFLDGRYHTENLN